MNDRHVARLGLQDDLLTGRNVLVGDGVAVFYSGVLALEVAAGQDLGGPGFKSTRIEVRNGRGQVWLGVALVRPVLVPALGADKAGGFVADLTVVEIEVRA